MKIYQQNILLFISRGMLLYIAGMPLAVGVQHVLHYHVGRSWPLYAVEIGDRRMQAAASDCRLALATEELHIAEQQDPMTHFSLHSCACNSRSLPEGSKGTCICMLAWPTGHLLTVRQSAAKQLRML